MITKKSLALLIALMQISKHSASCCDCLFGKSTYDSGITHEEETLSDRPAFSGNPARVADFRPQPVAPSLRPSSPYSSGLGERTSVGGGSGQYSGTPQPGQQLAIYGSSHAAEVGEDRTYGSMAPYLGGVGPSAQNPNPNYGGTLGGFAGGSGAGEGQPTHVTVNYFQQNVQHVHNGASGDSGFYHDDQTGTMLSAPNHLVITSENRNMPVFGGDFYFNSDYVQPSLIKALCGGKPNATLGDITWSHVFFYLLKTEDGFMVPFTKKDSGQAYVTLCKFNESGTLTTAKDLEDAKNSEGNLRKFAKLELLDEAIQRINTESAQTLDQAPEIAQGGQLQIADTAPEAANSANVSDIGYAFVYKDKYSRWAEIKNEADRKRITKENQYNKDHKVYFVEFDRKILQSAQPKKGYILYDLYYDESKNRFLVSTEKESGYLDNSVTEFIKGIVGTPDTLLIADYRDFRVFDNVFYIADDNARKAMHMNSDRRLEDAELTVENNHYSILFDPKDGCRVLFRREEGHPDSISLHKINSAGQVVKAKNLQDAKDAEPALRHKLRLYLLGSEIESVQKGDHNVIAKKEGNYWTILKQEDLLRDPQFPQNKQNTFYFAEVKNNEARTYPIYYDPVSKKPLVSHRHQDYTFLCGDNFKGLNSVINAKPNQLIIGNHKDLRVIPNVYRKAGNAINRVALYSDGTETLATMTQDESFYSMLIIEGHRVLISRKNNFGVVDLLKLNGNTVVSADNLEDAKAAEGNLRRAVKLCLLGEIQDPAGCEHFCGYEENGAWNNIADMESAKTRFLEHPSERLYFVSAKGRSGNRRNVYYDIVSGQFLFSTVTEALSITDLERIRRSSGIDITFTQRQPIALTDV